MSNKQKTVNSDLICMKCGNITSIRRKPSQRRKISHIKDLWCYNCEEITKHYEVQDIEIFMESEVLTNEAKKVKKLIKRKGGN